jgi:hypothetical protein
MSGRNDQNHLIADCLRALGRPSDRIVEAAEALIDDEAHRWTAASRPRSCGRRRSPTTVTWRPREHAAPVPNGRSTRGMPNDARCGCLRRGRPGRATATEVTADAEVVVDGVRDAWSTLDRALPRHCGGSERLGDGGSADRGCASQAPSSSVGVVVLLVGRVVLGGHRSPGSARCRIAWPGWTSGSVVAPMT